MSTLFPREGDTAVVRMKVVSVSGNDCKVTAITDSGRTITLVDGDRYIIEPTFKVGERVHDTEGCTGEVLRQRGSTAIVLWSNGKVDDQVLVADLSPERDDLIGLPDGTNVPRGYCGHAGAGEDAPFETA